jgi:Flp pilus assembly protein TadB
MTKIGVGIGEDFPADDTKPAEAPRRDRRCGYCANDADHAARREADRKWREQRREWRRQWKKARHEQRNERRHDWHAWSRAFQRDLHDNIVRNVRHGISASIRGDFRRRRTSSAQPEWSETLVWSILALIAIIALVSFVFANLFTIVGAIAILALIAAYYRGHDPFALEPDDQSPPQPVAS